MTAAAESASLVICTRNRAEQLRATLEAVSRMQYDRAWEVICVDNGSTDSTRSVVEEFIDGTRLRLRYKSEPVLGLSHARNAGWRACTGAIIAFTDDDCYPGKDFLSETANCFAEQHQLGFVGGRITLFDALDAAISIQLRDRPIAFETGDFISAGDIQGANFSFRRSALESVNGFDTRLGAGTRFPCEDIDVVARLLVAGWSGRYDPRPVVAHHHRRRADDEIEELVKGYDRGRGAYYAKQVMRSSTRRVSLRHWLSAVRRQTLRTTLRELMGAAEFVTFSRSVRSASS